MLEVIELNGVKTVTTNTATNHVYLVDVSGSMYSALPKMKEHLKNTISLLTKPDDTFSIIYFSGRGQCGIVCEGVEVRDIQQMTTLHNAVDRWLNVICLTGFIEPLKLAKDIVTRQTNNNPFNFVMLTDGYDNCWSREDIIEEASSLTDYFASCSFIEFGWYCDRPLIAKMAEATGGFHLFGDGHTEYQKAFEEAVIGAVRVPKIAVPVNKRAKNVIYIQDDQIVIAQPSDGIINVPESVERVHSIIPSDVLSKQLSDDHLFIIMYYAAKTNDAVVVWNCLERLGDVALIKQYNNAFSKQELSDFLDVVKACVLDASLRFVEGKDTTYVPAKDAYTVVDLLNDLADEEAVYLYSKMFKYNRTGAKREQTDTEIEFIPGVSESQKITGVVFNVNRANVNIQTVEKGKVRVPENEHNITLVDSFRTKNYTVIKDGIINTPKLPVVVLTASRFVSKLIENNVSFQWIDEGDIESLIEIDLMSVPVINRNMINRVSLDDFKTLVLDINRNAAKQKVAKHFKPVNRTAGLAEKYGDEAAKWLSSIGVRDYGFSPYASTKKGEETDAYVAHELKYNIKGLSSLPSINAVEKKHKENKKLTVGESLVDEFLADGDVWADKTKEIIDEQRALIRQMSEYVYSIIVGRVWFDGIEEREFTTDVDINGKAVNMSIDLKETLISI